MYIKRRGIALQHNEANQRKRILFIINPNSGVIKKECPLKELVMLFEDYGYETIPCFTRKQGDGTLLVKERASSDIDLVIGMGGDGTLNEVIAGVYAIGWDKPIGYIPAGSTNDFANSLGISSNPLEAAKQIMEGTPKALDLGKFNERIFVYTACCGIFSRTSYETPQRFKNKLGHLAYLMEGIKDIRDFKPVYMEITTDCGEYRDNYIFAALCNTFSLGGIMSLEELGVDLADGVFEMLLISEPGDLSELRGIVRCLYEETFDSPYVKMCKVTKAEISYLTGEDWSLDGERGVGMEKNTFEVIPNGLQLKY